MKKVYGIQSGMMMQRDSDTNMCSITLTIENAIDPVASMGKLTCMENGMYHLTGIPTGGPYVVTITDEDNCVEFSDLWVGDVWLLGGQSNMEGWAPYREIDRIYDKTPNPKIRAFYLDDHWDAAVTQLHQQWTNADLGLAEKKMATLGLTLAERDTLTLNDCGIGPGLFIGRYLLEHTGIPQGLILCAFGGTCMDDWMPENTTPASQYQSMLRRFKACGSNVRGMFWYQGESDIEWIAGEKFTGKVEHFLSTMRTDFGLPQMPFVQAQIAYCRGFSHMQLDTIAAWMKIRRQQAQMPEYMPYFSTISTANTYLHDMIHIDTPSQEAVGKAMAMEMLAQLGEPDMANPKLKSIEICNMEGHLYFARTGVVLTYDHVIGGFQSNGHPNGYSITLFDEIPYLWPYKGIEHIKLEGNKVIIVTPYSLEQLRHGYVWYGAGPNTICTIQDAEGRAPLAMGPVPIVSALG